MTGMLTLPQSSHFGPLTASLELILFFLTRNVGVLNLT